VASALPQTLLGELTTLPNTLARFREVRVKMRGENRQRKKQERIKKQK